MYPSDNHPLKRHAPKITAGHCISSLTLLSLSKVITLSCTDTVDYDVYTQIQEGLVTELVFVVLKATADVATYTIFWFDV